MNRFITIALGTALALVLSGCATSIRSDVTTFHQWPAQIADKSSPTFYEAVAKRIEKSLRNRVWEFATDNVKERAES